MTVFRSAERAPCPECVGECPWARVYHICGTSLWWCPTCHRQFDDDYIVEDREDEETDDFNADGYWIPDWAVGIKH